MGFVGLGMEKEINYTGRYLKALVNDAHGTPYKKGFSIKIEEDHLDGNVSCEMGYRFGGNEYNWKGCNVKLMPEVKIPRRKREKAKATHTSANE